MTNTMVMDKLFFVLGSSYMPNSDVLPEKIDLKIEITLQSPTAASFLEVITDCKQ